MIQTVGASLWLASAAEAILLKVLVQLIIIIAAARIFALMFRRIGQPAVVGEIAAGLVLGPSLFGWLFPDLSQLLFGQHTGPIPQWLAMIGIGEAVLHADAAPVFSVLAQLGLVFLLFIIGLEFDFSHLKSNRTASSTISITGIVLPFSFGFALAHWMYPTFEQTIPNRTGFCLFMGTAMSITAIPILGRIMMEYNLTRTRLGAITITAAAVDDAIGWILLASVTSMVTTGYSALLSLRMIGLTLLYAFVLMVFIRPMLLRWTARHFPKHDTPMGLNTLAIVLLLLFASSIITSLIGIFAIFGAFLLGAALSADRNFHAAFVRGVSHFVNAFFLPIFFTYTGLRTDIGSLDTAHLWWMAGAVLILAVAGKFLGCGLAARWSGLSWRESVGVGAMMNTRALMELIVINVGYDLGVIPKEVFCMLVIMALVTTVMTSPFLRRIMRGDPEFDRLLATSAIGSRA